MKVYIVLLAILGLAAVKGIENRETKHVDKDFLAKQKFLLEIVYRIEDPLVFDEYIKLGQSFEFNTDDYNVSVS